MSGSPTRRDPDPAPRLVLGIDLGTTNSLAAVMGRKGPKVLRTKDGRALLPSVVCFPPGGARELCGAEARAQALTLPERTVHSIKRLIGRAGDEVDAEAARLPYPVVRGPRDLARVRIDGRDYSPEELSAKILAHVRDVARQALGGAEVREAVITVPAYFDDAQRQATKDAAELAGLDCLRIVNEPTAASLAYGIDGTRDGVVMVYDLGGGTFDVSILKIKDGVFRVLATAGDTHLGGDDFDRLLAQKILDQVHAGGAGGEGGARTPPERQSPFAMQAIRASAEGLKIALSEREQASLEIDLGEPGAAGAPDDDRTPRILSVTRPELEQLITPLVDETMHCCRRALKDAGLTVQQLDEVVLVGGSTRIPLVRRRLEELTGKPPHTEVDPDLCVALGAAIQADILAGQNRSLLLIDVIPLSLGIETMGSVVSKLIMRNATIPTSVTEEFSTQVDDQSAVDINIYQGERERVEDCRKLGAFKLRGIPPMPAGLPRIAVTFLVDADGVLRVTAKEQRTDIESSIQVVPSFGLTRDEVHRMMHDSIEHATEDMALREGIELRNKALAMAKGTRHALGVSDLPPDQTWSVKQSLQKLEQLLAERADTDTLRAAVDDLSRRTAQIADDVLGSAVKKALTDP